MFYPDQKLLKDQRMVSGGYINAICMLSAQSKSELHSWNDKWGSENCYKSVQQNEYISFLSLHV